jgi:hypothetical protein
MAMDVPVQDASHLPPSDARAVLEAVVAEAGEQPFDFENGPLVRARLVKLADAHHALLLTVHHLVVDGWSLNVMLEEIGRLYQARLTGTQASLLPPLATREFSRLEREQRTQAQATETRDYWLQQFAALPDPLELPTTRARPPIRSHRAATESFVVGGHAAARLRKASAALGCGPMHLLLASYSVLLHRLSNCKDFVVGVPAASSLSAVGVRITRDRSLVGDHVTLLPLRMRHPPEQTFEEHVRSVKNLVLGAYEHQHCALGELVSQLGVSRARVHGPLVSTTFNFERAGRVSAIDGVETETTFPPKACEFFDLVANVTDAEDALRIDLTFNTDIFDAEVIRAWLAAWRVLLDGAATLPTVRVADMPLLSPQEQQVVLKGWNATESAVPDECVHRQMRAGRANAGCDRGGAADLRALHEGTRLAARLRERG